VRCPRHGIDGYNGLAISLAAIGQLALALLNDIRSPGHSTSEASVERPNQERLRYPTVLIRR